MRSPFGAIRVSKREAAWGATSALHVLFIPLLVAMAFALTPVSAQETTAENLCFSPSLCKKYGGDFARDENCAGKDAGKCYARPDPTQLTVAIGGRSTVLDIGDYIATTYRYGVGIAAIIAAVMMMIGGFQYLTAGGDSGRVSAGKQRITDALVGLCLALGAFVLLNTVNPDLVKLQLPRVPMTKTVLYGGCKETELCFACGVKYFVLNNPNIREQKASAGCVMEGDMANVTLDGNDPNVSGECMGRGCFALAGDKCGDESHRCQKASGPDEKPVKECDKEPSPPPAAGSDRYICKGCTGNGGPCSTNGRNTDCCGGFCSEGKCTAGAPGDDCQDDNQCATNICQTNFGNSCSSGEVGATCADNSECKPDYRCSTAGKNSCTPGKKYSWCDGDEECFSGLRCDTDGVNMCMPEDEEKVFGCDKGKNAKCPGGYCASPFLLKQNVCTDGSPGAPCGADNECAPPTKQSGGGAWKNEGVCISKTSSCSNGWLGTRCESDTDCEFKHCYTSGDYALCVSGNLGSRCDGSNDCGQHNGAQLTCKDSRCLQ